MINIKGFKTIINKYNGTSNAFKASIWFALCNILQKGVSLLTIPIFTRVMTTEQYGVYSVYQSWYQVISIFATLNLSLGVFNNGMLKFENNRDKYIASQQGLSTSITMLLFIVYLFGVDYWNDLLGLSTLFIVAMFMELLFVPAYSFWTARNRYEFKYKAIVITTIIVAISSPILGIITVLSTSYKAEARVLSFVFVQVCVGFIFYIHNFIKGKSFFNKEYWKFALAFNIPLIPHYLSQTILQQADRIMISEMVGKDKAAIYSIAYNVSSLMLIITSAVNHSYVPYTYECLKNKNYENLRKRTNDIILLVAVFTILVMFFGPEVIKIFAPIEYYEAIWIIPPVSASVLFMFLYPVFGNVEFFYEENKFVMCASIGGALANIVLNYFFIQKFGYIAAGYTTLLCYILLVYGHYLFMRKVLRKHYINNQLYDINFILKISVIELIVMLIILILYRNVIMRYLGLIVTIAILLLKYKDIVGRGFKKK